MIYSQIDINKRKTIILLFLFLVLMSVIAGIMFFFYGIELVILIFILTIIILLFSWFSGDSTILYLNSANKIKKNDYPELYRIVENLAITAGLPTPNIYIINTTDINAFATGKDPKHASVAISKGALKNLEKKEIEAVIAHEISHIKNYDTRVMMIAITAVAFIVILSDLFLRITLWGGRRKRDENTGIISLIIVILFLIISPIIANLIKLAISREREYLADADAVLLNRYPQALISALEKVKKYNHGLKHFSKQSADIFFANPFAKANSFTSKLFSTHPSIDSRIKRLKSFNF